MGVGLFEICKSRKYRAMVEYAWRRRGAATRADIARDLHLSNTTVFPAVDHLVRTGVMEAVAMPTGNKGRKPGGLRLCGKQGFAIGISIWHHTDICVVDVGQHVVCGQRIAGCSQDSMGYLRQLRVAVDALARKARLDMSRLVGVGVTLPGLVDHINGIVRKSSYLASDREVRVGAFFEEQYGRPCVLISAAPVLALSEKEWGGAGGLSNFLYYCGTGLGMYLGGRLFTGEQGYAGEIGFMKFDGGLDPSVDTRPGAFERGRPFRQVGLRLQTLVERGAVSVAADWLREGRAPSLDMVIDGALQGDALCRELIADGFRVDADMIASLAYLFNPAAVFLLPWAGKCPDISLDIVQRRLDLCRLVNPDMRVEARVAQYGREELARGVAMLPLNRFFGMPSF